MSERRAARQRAGGVTALLAIVVLVGGACVGPTSSATGVAGSGSSGAVPSSAVGAPGTIVGFDDTNDPSAASHRELELVHESRDSAGMPALLGAAGPAGFTTLDATEAAFGFKTLKEAAAQPLAQGTGHGLAALADDGRTPILAPAAVDISLFADTGFTASAIMSIYADLVANAGQAGSGSISRDEPHDETDAAGNHQHVTLHMVMSVVTGGGKVSAEINMSATDRITGSDGHLIGTYTSSANGHFEVDACPDDNGNAKGKYSFATSHAMGDTGQAPAKADRGVSAPFTLVDDETAHLTRIEADMSLAADASGPGTAAGPGPTSAFDWQASDHLQISMPARGGSPIDFTGSAPTVTGTGGTGASGSLLVSAAMAQLFLAEVGKKAQDFWRSGQCIELKPSDDTRKVQPNEKIELTVKATAKFGDHKEIAKPITAKFTGTKSLDPNGTPVDEPAKFTFTAGPNKDDKGTIDLEQTSKRGIGKRQIVFTVDAPAFQVTIDATVHEGFAGNVYDTSIHLKPLDLTPAPDGTFSASATVSWTTTYHPPAECKPKTYTGTFDTKVMARVDPADPTRVLLTASFIPAPLKPEVLECKGRNFPFVGGTSLGVWAFLGAEHAVPIDGSLSLHPPVAAGTATTTIMVTKKH